MSIEHMTAVWKHAPFDQTTLLVLLCLADYADDGGRSWPSVAKIAERARCSERHATRVLGELEESGWLVRTPRAGHSTTYTVVIRGDKMAPLPSASGTPALHVVTGGELGGTTGGDPGVRENHQVEPPFDPPRNRQRRKSAPHRIPADWMPSQKALDWTRENYPNVDVSRETSEMIKYFSRPDAPKRDGWDKTWYGWVKRAADRQAEKVQAAGGTWWH